MKYNISLIAKGDLVDTLKIKLLSSGDFVKVLDHKQSEALEKGIFDCVDGDTSLLVVQDKNSLILLGEYLQFYENYERMGESFSLLPRPLVYSLVNLPKVIEERLAKNSIVVIRDLKDLPGIIQRFYVEKLF